MICHSCIRNAVWAIVRAACMAVEPGAMPEYVQQLLTGFEHM